jgi:hypothetical protein
LEKKIMPRFKVTLANKLDGIIKAAVVTEVNRRINKIKLEPIQNKVKNEIKKQIKGTRHYRSLTSDIGLLLRHFGLTNADEKMDAVIEAVMNTVSVRFTRARRQNENTILIASMDIQILKGGIIQLLQLNEGYQETDKGQQLHWLDWILTKGESVIVTGYDVVLADFGDISRTGGALMFKKKDDGGWNVPINLAGTVQNNFITQALEEGGVVDYARELMSESLIKAIKGVSI